MRERLVAMVHGEDGYVCVPVQGVGNTANEAVLGTLVPRERKLLIVDNGFYGARLSEIAAAIGVPFAALELPWTEPVTGAQLDAALAADAAISHVIVCHVDTGTGLLNPIEPLAEVARRRGVALIVDAIASFSGLPIDAAALDLEAIVASPTEWLEGLPGIGLVVVKRTALAAAAGPAHSFCLDLHRQWQSFEHDWRSGSRRRPRPPPPWSRRSPMAGGPGGAPRAGAPQLALPGRRLRALASRRTWDDVASP